MPQQALPEPQRGLAANAGPVHVPAADAAEQRRDAPQVSDTPPRNDLPSPGTTADARTATGTTEPPDVLIHVTLILGGITNVRTPVAVSAHYESLCLAGPTAAFDRKLDGWLTRAVDIGIIGLTLGQLFTINFAQYHKSKEVNAKNLILAGMGEPGCFAQDSLRLVMSNIVVAVKSMGEDQFATTLLGTRRKEMSIADALRGFLQGLLDGYERLGAIAEAVKEDREALRSAATSPLSVLLVHADERAGKAIEDELNAVTHDSSIKHLTLTITRGKAVKADDSAWDDTMSKAPPDAPVTFMRITRSRSGASGEHPIAPATAKPHALDPFPSKTFQFSALSDRSVVPQREEVVNARLLRDAAERLTRPVESGEKDHSRVGTYFANTVMPEDFRKLSEGPASLTIEVDEASAVYPWEMIAQTRFAKTSFVSHNIALSRQFRSLLSPPPTSPPTLNNRLKVLVIADPVPGLLALAGARREGLAVVDVLEKARIAWGDRYDITAEVRIGPSRDAQAEQILKALRRRGSWLNAKPCDPLELAILIVNDQQDIIHYAGHGVADQRTGQTGWVFAPDCVLSAKEIFRVRQVPRLVFANACFSAMTSDREEMRKQMTGLAQAFFARGIPNFIGAGWAVDDACAEECARWFYARLFGLRAPDSCDCDSPTLTIGQALKAARKRAFAADPTSSSWGAYQHYGNPTDRLLAYEDVPPARAPTPPAGDLASFAIALSDAPPPPLSAGNPCMTEIPQTAGPQTGAPQPGKELIYVNGIDFNTGQYAVPPQPIDEIAKRVFQRPGLDKFSDMHAEHERFAIPFGVDLDQPTQAGWGIIFHPDTAPDVRAALAPLVAHRRKQIGDLVKELDYLTHEQTRDWYRRHGVSPGGVDPAIVPYYLLLVGGPELIPFEFQYLLGVDYAVGRLAFDTAGEYDHYARSIIAYETAGAVPNGREIAYWGTRHPSDSATNLSATLLIDPLANGLADGGLLKTPIHADSKVNYQRKLMAADGATKANLLDLLHQAKPPAMLFTASHGMQLRSGQSAQAATQGALLCQDWTGFGSVKAAHILAAADVPDDANVNGMVAMIFACFGAGTPDADQFVMDLSQAGSAPTLAPKPFMSALPRRLLTHPNGSALAVIGHIDRAWAYSIQAPKTAGPQILAFRNSLGFIMTGMPIGYVLNGQFSSRFAALSAALLSATSPTAPPAMRLPDRDLVTAWIQRNDAQNYLLLGDPAARIRADVLT